MSVAAALAELHPQTLHASLATFNRDRLRPACDDGGWAERLAAAHTMGHVECRWVEQERTAVAAMLHDLPDRPDAFLAWFEALAVRGPGQGDPLFDWLATAATRDQLAWFLRQELAGEAGFEDLVALTQVGLGARAKLELARNYWDEMGRGHAGGMHGPMLARLEAQLDDECSAPAPIVWESLALANTMVALASHRHYAYHSIGALGAIELTAPGRCTQVDAGLRRLGFDGAARRYYAVHASIDIRHSREWNAEAILPLVAEDPARMRPIAEGALIRLRAGARCFERYRRELGLRARAAA